MPYKEMWSKLLYVKYSVFYIALYAKYNANPKLLVEHTQKLVSSSKPTKKISEAS